MRMPFLEIIVVMKIMSFDTKKISAVSLKLHMDYKQNF